MSRNLDRRVELLFPVEHPPHRAAVLHALRAMFRDNVKARVLGPDGVYTRVSRAPGEGECRVQLALMEEAHRRAAQAADRAGITLRPARQQPPR
jgi:polyphosphate kinase